MTTVQEDIAISKMSKALRDGGPHNGCCPACGRLGIMIDSPQRNGATAHWTCLTCRATGNYTR